MPPKESFERLQLYYEQLEVILRRQMNRKQNYIVIVTDEREDLDVTLIDFDGRVDVLRIPDMKFGNVFLSIKQHSKFGKGTIFVFSGGTLDLLHYNCLPECEKCDCRFPQQILTLPKINGNHAYLINKALKLNLDLLDSTLHDVAIFCGLMPVPFEQYYNSILDRRRCFSLHSAKDIPFDEKNNFTNYRIAVKWYNDFTKYHAKTLFYDSWDLEQSYFCNPLQTIFAPNYYSICPEEATKRCKLIKMYCTKLLTTWPISFSSQLNSSKFESDYTQQHEEGRQSRGTLSKNHVNNKIRFENMSSCNRRSMSPFSDYRRVETVDRYSPNQHDPRNQPYLRFHYSLSEQSFGSHHNSANDPAFAFSSNHYHSSSVDQSFRTRYISPNDDSSRSRYISSDDLPSWPRHMSPRDISYSSQHISPGDQSYSYQHCSVDRSSRSRHRSPYERSSRSQHRSPSNLGSNSQHISSVDRSFKSQHLSPVDRYSRSLHLSSSDPSSSSRYSSPVDRYSSSQHLSPDDRYSRSRHLSPRNLPSSSRYSSTVDRYSSSQHLSPDGRHSRSRHLSPRNLPSRSGYSSPNGQTSMSQSRNASKLSSCSRHISPVDHSSHRRIISQRHGTSGLKHVSPYDQSSRTQHISSRDSSISSQNMFPSDNYAMSLQIRQNDQFRKERSPDDRTSSHKRIKLEDCSSSRKNLNDWSNSSLQSDCKRRITSPSSSLGNLDSSGRTPNQDMVELAKAESKRIQSENCTSASKEPLGSLVRNDVTEILDTQNDLRRRLGDHLFEEYSVKLEIARSSFNKKFELYRHLPQMYPLYKPYQDSFSATYDAQYGSGNPEHKDSWWKRFWHSNYESIKIEEWQKEVKKFKEIYFEKAAMQPSTSSTFPLSSFNFSFTKSIGNLENSVIGITSMPVVSEEALCLIESVCDKLSHLGPALKVMVAKCRTLGTTSKEAYSVLTNPDNLILLKLALTKLKALHQSSTGDERIIYGKVVDRIMLYSKRNIAAISPSMHNSNDINKPVIDINKSKLELSFDKSEPTFDIDNMPIDLNAVADATMGKGDAVTLEIVKTALAYKGILEPPPEVIRGLFLKVCSLHFTRSFKT